MKIIRTEIDGVVIVEPNVFVDGRGWFMETFSHDRFANEVRDTVFVQDNEAFSRRGVVRGLHFQLPPHAQSKLVRAVRGRVIDVAVDIRRGSPTFGRHVAVELSAENHRQLFVPRGFAHGYAVVSDDATVMYKVDNYYAPQSEGGIRWDDPALGIDWEITADEALVADKDMMMPPLAGARLFDFNEKLY